MDLSISELSRKGLSYAWEEVKRVKAGMASDQYHTHVTHTTYREVRGIQVADVRYIPLHSVGLRRIPPRSLRSPYPDLNYSERMVYQDQEGGSSQMEGVESNSEWQHITPSGNVYPDDPDRTHEYPDPRRHGHGGHWEWKPMSSGDDTNEGGAPINPHGDGPEAIVESHSEEIPKEQGNSEVVDNDNSRREGFLVNNSATVNDPSDFDQTDSHFLDAMNISSNRPQGGQGAIDRAASARINEMQIENSNLLNNLKVLQDTLDMQIRDSDREKNELKGKLAQYIRKTQQLNQIIIKNANKSNEPPDTEIERATAEICSDIVSVIRTHYAGSKVKVSMTKARQWKDESFYKAFKDKAPETKRRLLIDRLFSLLNVGIFSAKIYGLDAEADFSFESFERAILANPKIPRQDAEEWRVRTVSCASKLNHPLDDKVTVMLKWIWEHFCAIELSGPNGDTPLGINDIKVALRDVCEKSIKLTLRFRSTETRYSFQIPAQSSFMGRYPDENYRIMGTEGDLSPDVEEDEKKQRVYCVLFGALMKTRPATATDEEKTVVLFPAHVITYEDERDRDKERERKDREQRRRN